MKNLTASDRKNLIRLASELPKGSDERRALLSGLKISGEEGEDTSSSSGGGVSGLYLEFMEEVGDEKRKNPDTDQEAKIRNWKGEKGKKIIQEEFKKWKEDRAKKNDEGGGDEGGGDEGGQEKDKGGQEKDKGGKKTPADMSGADRMKAVSKGVSDALGKHKSLFKELLADDPHGEVADMSMDELQDAGSLKENEDGSWTGDLPDILAAFSSEYPEEGDEVMEAWASKITGIPAKDFDQKNFTWGSRGIRIKMGRLNRKPCIRLASVLPQGSEERRALLVMASGKLPAGRYRVELVHRGPAIATWKSLSPRDIEHLTKLADMIFEASELGKGSLSDLSGAIRKWKFPVDKFRKNPHYLDFRAFDDQGQYWDWMEDEWDGPYPV